MSFLAGHLWGATKKAGFDFAKQQAIRLFDKPWAKKNVYDLRFAARLYTAVSWAQKTQGTTASAISKVFARTPKSSFLGGHSTSILGGFVGAGESAYRNKDLIGKDNADYAGRVGYSGVKGAASSAAGHAVGMLAAKGGAIAGAKLGAVIGSFFGPGPGTVVGATIGAVVGAVAGYAVASYATKKAVEGGMDWATGGEEKVGAVTSKAVTAVGKGVKAVGKALADGAKSVASGVGKAWGWLKSKL